MVIAKHFALQTQGFRGFLLIHLRHGEADVDEDVVADLELLVLHETDVDLPFDADDVDQGELVVVARKEFDDAPGDGETHAQWPPAWVCSGTTSAAASVVAL